MKVLLLVGPGENQRALACRLHAAYPLDHIARITLPASKVRRNWMRSLTSLTIGRGLRNAWRNLMVHHGTLFPSWPATNLSDHSGVNSQSVLALLEEIQPDLVLVSGTDLLRAPLIEAIEARGKVMNLHTGISPFIKGAPNCTNWALAIGEFGLIGNTVMWIDAGVDSGAIIATEQTALDGRETLTQLHIKVMDHAHDLFARAYARYCEGRPIPSVRQASLGEGRLYLSRHWNSRAIARAAFNYVRAYRPATLARAAGPELVSLDQA